MISVSLCMIVKNDEAVVERCLKSVKDLVDEIIIVDLNSTDRTREIVSSFTNKIYKPGLEDNELNALKDSFTFATKDFILWLKPSEVLLVNDQNSFLQLKQSLNPDVKSVAVEYRDGWSKEPTEKITKLFKNDNATIEVILSKELEHSSAQTTSNLSITNLPYTKNTEENLNIFEKMIENNILFSPRDLFYYAMELSNDNQYVKSIEYFLKYLRTNQVYEEHNILACNSLANCYHHLNLQEVEKTWLLKALQYGKTHPEICCRLGYLFFEKNNYESAIYWYEEAVLNKTNERLLNHNPSCTTWLPHLQLAVCYDRIGEYELANEHNELALNYYPTHPSILSNQQYFLSRLGK